MKLIFLSILVGLLAINQTQTTDIENLNADHHHEDHDHDVDHDHADHHHHQDHVHDQESNENSHHHDQGDHDHNVEEGMKVYVQIPTQIGKLENICKNLLFDAKYSLGLKYLRFFKNNGQLLVVIHDFPLISFKIINNFLKNY